MGVEGLPQHKGMDSPTQSRTETGTGEDWEPGEQGSKIASGREPTQSGLDSQNTTVKGTEGLPPIKIYDVTRDTDWEQDCHWLYTGEGEWSPNISPKERSGTGTHSPSMTNTDLPSGVDEDVNLHGEVWKKGYPNRWGARIPVQSGWNLELLQSLLQGYTDKDISEMVTIWVAHRQTTHHEGPNTGI